MPSLKRSTILTAGLATFFLLLAFAACSETGTPSPTGHPPVAIPHGARI